MFVRRCKVESRRNLVRKQECTLCSDDIWDESEEREADDAETEEDGEE